MTRRRGDDHGEFQDRRGCWRVFQAGVVAVVILGVSIGAAPRASMALSAVAAPRAGLAASTAPGSPWRFDTGGRPLLTAPAAGGDGSAFVAGWNGVLYALAPDGRVRWSLPTGVTSGPVPPARAAVGPDGSSYWTLSGAVVAVSPVGRVAWTFLAGGSGSPVYDVGRVLFVAGPYLYAVEATGPHAGTRLWRAAVGSANTASGTATPAPAVGPDGTVYVASPDGYVYAIGANGLRRWAYATGTPLAFGPVADATGVYADAFVGGHGTLYALTPAGRLRWRLGLAAGSDVARATDGSLLIGAHLLYDVSPGGTVRWTRTVDAAAAPSASGAFALVPTLSPPAILALSLADGAVQWRTALARAAVGPVAVGPSGRLYAGDDAGVLTALDPTAHGAGRALHSTATAGPVVDLGASNTPFTAAQGAMHWRVTLARSVERSTDGGRSWRVVFSPGASTPDARAQHYRNARYADVTFLATPPSAGGLYVGTSGALGDYLMGGRGGADGGLYDSADGVSGWRLLSQGLPYTVEPRLRAPTYGIDTLGFDPVKRGVLYAQTSAAFGSPGRDAGLYKSVDGGAHWREATHGLPVSTRPSVLLGPYHAYPTGALLIDRARPSVLFLVASAGLYRSADGAASWARARSVLYDDPASVAVRLGAGAAVDAYTDRGAFHSTDYGAHWRKA